MAARAGGARPLELCAVWDRIGDPLVSALVSPFPPVRPGLSLLTRLRGAGGLDLVKTLLTPATELGRRGFGGESAGLLVAGNAGHADLPLDAPGSGVFGLLMTMLGQTVGFPVPEGGAGRLSQALARRLESLGGEILCDSEIAHVVVEHGRAVGVVTADGTTPGAPCSPTSAPPTCSAVSSTPPTCRPG